MLIPSKHSGYQAGIRLYPGGGGGGTGGPGTGGSIGGGGMGSAANGGPGEGGGFGGGNPGQNVTNPATTNTTAATMPGNTWGASTYSPTQIQSAIDISRQQGFSDQDIMTGLGRYNVPNNVAANSVYGPERIQSAIDTSRQQGFSNQDILTGLSRYGVNSGPQQNAVMAQTSGARPSSSNPQFYQPVYQGQYQNYASPLNAFNVSTYGTNAGPSNAQQYANLPGGIGQNQFMRNTQNYAANAMSQPGGADINRTLQDMRTYGMSPQDMQSAYSYGAPQQSFTANNPFNAYTGSAYSPQQMQNAIATSQQQGFSSQDIATGLGRNGVYLSPQQTQMYNPYTPPQQQYQQQMQTPFSYGQQSYQPQSPFSYQQPQQQYNPYTPQQPMYQQPQPQVFPRQQTQQPYDQVLPRQQPSYGGGSNFIPDTPLSDGMIGTMGGAGYDPSTGRVDLGSAGGSGQYVSRAPTPPRSSGPSQAIVGRSAGYRGTPNVMRRAEGGITEILKK